MIGRFVSTLTSLRRRTRQRPRRPKRSRSWIVEGLEGRRLLSNLTTLWSRPRHGEFDVRPPGQVIFALDPRNFK
jgi:hypothetical protein